MTQAAIQKLSTPELSMRFRIYKTLRVKSASALAVQSMMEKELNSRLK